MCKIGDILLIYDDCDASRLLAEADKLRNCGQSVRVERTVPDGMKFRKTVYFGRNTLC